MSSFFLGHATTVIADRYLHHAFAW
jgi:hypothetical protein